MVTFEVDEVKEATAPPPTKQLEALISGALWFAPGAETRVLDPGGVHPLLAAMHHAFAEHRPLVLSPDVVWLTIAQGFAQHVRLNAEALQSRLVRHSGRRSLVVEVDALPTDGAGIQEVLSAFRGQLREEIGLGLPRLLSCDFSTSTDIERMAGDVVLMDTFSPYFDFLMVSGCGIPRVTLLGTSEDWRSIRRRIDVIAEFDLAWWTSSLVPIAEEFVRASEGKPDRKLWQEIYKPRAAYGAERVSGWIGRLFPYIGDNGRFDQRNSLLEMPHAKMMATAERTRGNPFQVPGFALNEAPSTLSSVPLEVEDLRQGTRATWALEAGVLAVEVDGGGALLPRVGVVVRRGEVSVAQVIERILSEHEATKATQASKYRGLAELSALYDRISRATLFSGTRPWYLRALEEHDEIRIPLQADRYTSVRPLVDLPDGTVLALHIGGRRRPVGIVRLRADMLEPVPPPSKDAIQRLAWTEGTRSVLQTREWPGDIPVVGTSLAALLAGTLDTGGSTELPVVGMLAQDLESGELGPRRSKR
ncbi:DUF4419 domain-containing protein [Hyalangium versicolor]|uniref:DUF4419 domain-containing protein n=1 Tax=Hyalangium versicolor TaxID=2861190 RepID=UPI001CC9EB39|nr:DUF4419 domain-containing protein [Hyalangium versicolor]